MISVGWGSHAQVKVSSHSTCFGREVMISVGWGSHAQVEVPLHMSNLSRGE